METCNREVSGRFCCAIVLLAVIGQRAEALLSRQDVKRCEHEWRSSYLSKQKIRPVRACSDVL